MNKNERYVYSLYFGDPITANNIFLCETEEQAKKLMDCDCACEYSEIPVMNDKDVEEMIKEYWEDLKELEEWSEYDE